MNRTHKGYLMFVLGVLLAVYPAAGQVKVFATIQPLAYFVERIGGAHVAVDVLIGPGQNYHAYEPTPKQLASVASCQALFRVGVPMEDRLLDKVRSSGAAPAIVDTAEGIVLRTMSECEDDGHGHEEGAKDPHVWMSPANARAMAVNICGGLKRIDPGNARSYDENLRSFEKEIGDLDTHIRGMLEPFKGRVFYVNHPAFGYFADAYGLKQASMEVEGKEPTAKQLAALMERAKADGVKTIFVQRQFSKSSAEALAKEIGGETVYLDPLSGDYLKNLEDIAGRIKEGFRH